MSETTISQSEIFRGRILRLELHDVELPDGRHSRREIVRHSGAVAIVAELPDGRFLFVRQYRKAIEQVTLELPAGCIEPDETPEACAIREIREETGYEVSELRALGSVFSSPGFCDERLWLFHARLAAEPGNPQPDADEFVSTESFSRETIEADMLAGRIRDAKTIAAWWLFNQTRRP